ncbi:hypothetical protein J3R30DRAFT_1142065 [Lentinula aciculospora]|uniref:C2H2-type domain-containing protein n=1 Tax=Lentinula aciculospora TaxID=153920 RepID=A0A9W8ZZF1_9AGAR|nr:hypothetical protein J3R30DRAFT_1142065 [Lentinula aciculospora]
MPPPEMEENPVDKNNNNPSSTRASQRKTRKYLEKSADSEKAQVTSEGPPPTSVSKRPVTRSLSGRPIKRRIREDNAFDQATYSDDDSDSQPADHRPAAKKQKMTASSRRIPRKSAAAASKSSSVEILSHAHGSSANLTTAQDVHPQVSVGTRSTETTVVSTSLSTSTSSTAASTPQPMPLPSSSSNAPPLIATRIGTARAMRATLPTPVPNLTKKSRGRRVPVRVVTINGVEVIQDPPPVSSVSGTTAIGGSNENSDSTNSKGKRSYVCSVEGCGKCFHRGEHLKRHIRSIHTHDKPFKCTYPECDKNFNRHDNLLQHIKVHKQAQATAAMTASGEPVTLLPSKKGKGKLKGKGAADSVGSGSKLRSKSGKGRKKKRRRSSSSPDEEEEEDGESDAESAETASSDEDDVDEASAVSNLLSLRANASGLKGAPTLVAPLHHTLTSYTHTLSSMSSMSSTATVVGSISGWGYPVSSSSSFAPNGNSITGSKPYFSPFHTSFIEANTRKSYSSMFPVNGMNNTMSQFSLSKAYSSGATPYESSVAAAANGPGSGIDAERMHDIHDGYHRHHNGLGHVQNVVSDVRSANRMNDSEQLGTLQSDMAMSSLRSTSTSSASRNMEGPSGLEETNNSNGLDPGEDSVSRGSPLTRLSRPSSEGHEDVIRNLDPALATMDMQSRYSRPTTASIPNSRKAAEYPNPTDTVKSSSTPIATSVSPLPAPEFVSSKFNGSENVDQVDSTSILSPIFKKYSDFQSKQLMPMGTSGSEATPEPRIMLRPVESEKDWEI